MAYFMSQASYTAEAWAALVKNPQNRVEAIRPVLEKLGGSLEGTWFAFGDYDIVAIIQLPDNVSASAFALAAAAGGGLSNIKTTPLLTITEGIEALRKAGTAGYQPPK